MDQPQQPEFFPADLFNDGRDLLLTESEQRHRFTGEKVAKNKEKYALIIRCLAEGTSIRSTSRMLGVSTNTIMAIREREKALVDTEKTRLSNRFMSIARMAGESFIEAIEEGRAKPGELSIAAGIFTEKALLLAGQATSIVGRQNVEPSLDEVAAWGKDVIDITPRPEVTPAAPAAIASSSDSGLKSIPSSQICECSAASDSQSGLNYSHVACVQSLVNDSHGCDAVCDAGLSDNSAGNRAASIKEIGASSQKSGESAMGLLGNIDAMGSGLDAMTRGLGVEGMGKDGVGSSGVGGGGVSKGGGAG
jgi:hypothetical protein